MSTERITGAFQNLIEFTGFDYVIYLTKANKITNFDKKLIIDLNLSVKNPDDLIGLDIIKLVSDNTKYTADFASILLDIINNQGFGFCGFNTVINEGNILNIPAIYFLCIVVEEEVIANNIVKKCKIYNYFRIARELSNIIMQNLITPNILLAEKFKNNMKEKSLYCAFESFKPFISLISSTNVTNINRREVANVLFPFHQARITEGLNKRFIREFLRHDGYVENDRKRQIKKLGLRTLERITSRNVVACNRLDKNCIVRIS